MNVVDLRLYHVRIPLRKKIRHASHTRTDTDNLIARITLDSGQVGYGEGVPRAYVTGEDIDSAIALIQRSDLSSQFAHVSDWDAGVAFAGRLQLASVPGDVRQCQGNAARCAVELAYLDAIGRATGRPLSQVTKLVAPELYQASDRVQYSGALTSARNWKTRFASWAFRVFGFTQVKVKVGTAGQDDVRRMQSIRRRLGAKIDIRIDANEAWTPEEAAERIAELEAFQITSVEQPLPQSANEALAELRSRIRTPIMLDESLCSMIDAEQAVADRWCDLFNIRISKCGGLIPSLRLAAYARRNGLGYQLGCQVGESAILSAAGRHFATSVAQIRYLEGSYDRHLVRESLAQEDITFRWGGWANPLTAPGLGVTIDPTALKRITIREEVILAR